MFLRQSTSQIIRFGPFLDSTDGVTAETALTIAQADMQLSKDGAAFAQKNTTGNATHDADGWYSTTLDTTDTATVGELYMQVNVSGALPVWVRYWVIEESTYDALYGAAAAGFNSSGLVTLAAVTHTGAVIPTVSTLTGHTAQTGDSFARLGAPAGASISADIADVPTVAEFNARTLLAADYFDPAVDAVATVTNLTNLPAIPANWLTSAGIAASALDGKGDWNIGKTGYSLTQAFPTNFADLSISVTTGLVDITQTAADKAWSATTRILTAANNITSDNSAITMSSSGVVGTVNLTNTLTTYTGNTVQTGDSFARIGAPAGASVSADIASVKVDTGTTLPGIIDDLAVKKNTTFSNFEFLMVLTSDHATPATGLTVTGERSIDGAAFASVAGTITEVSNGIYQFDALAADTNGDVITWRFSAATADDTFVTFKTVA